MDSRDLSVELRQARPSYLVLRGAYGDRIHQSFRVSRQGVRWRFWRLFNQIYVSAFETILFIEMNFGPQLRDHAIRISRERYALRRDLAFQPADQLARERNRLRTSGDGP